MNKERSETEEEQDSENEEEQMLITEPDIEPNRKPITPPTSEQKLFICDICDKVFDSDSSLRMHRLRSHRLPTTGETPPESEEEEEELGKIRPPEVEFFEEIRGKLAERLPNVWGVTVAKTKDILDTLSPGLLQSPMAVHAHIRALLPKTNAYHLWTVIASVYGIQQQFQPPSPPMWSYPGSYPGQQIPYPYSQPDRSNQDQLLRRIETLEKELQTERVKLEEERYRRLEEKLERLEDRPSLLEQIQGIKILGAEMGWSEGKKSIYDILEKGITLGDRHFSKIENRLDTALEFGPGGSQPFRPEITRSPSQRAEKAEELKKRIRKSEEILESEDELLRAAIKVGRKSREERGEQIPKRGR